ncbi:MAG: hypothetical protein ACLVL7_10670 [Anaerotruncus massiliensis (ex Togo et al. 2019)]
MGKKTVAVVFGSVSSEYEVSLRSAASVLRNIPRDRYDVVMVGITKDGRWYEYGGSVDDLEADRWLENGPVTRRSSPPTAPAAACCAGPRRAGKRPCRRDLPRHAWRARRGRHHPGLFEMAGIPYVAAGAGLLHLHGQGRHPHLCSRPPASAPRPTRRSRPQLARFDSSSPPCGEARLPMFVKPANTGSSVGVGKAKDRAGCSPP